MFLSDSRNVLLVLLVSIGICFTNLLDKSERDDFGTGSQKLLRKRESITNVSAVDVQPPKDLCSDPIVHTIDRMSNGTVRIYRNRHFWDLNGLADKPTLDGPHLIHWEGMAPINQMTKIMTTVTGENAMSTFKIENTKFWAYNSEGKLFIGSPGNGVPIEVPNEGLTALLFNGNESKPLMLGFRGVSVFYYEFKAMKWQKDGDKDGYPQGRNGEKFPGDLFAAFAVPLKTGYEAYLFKGEKYCQRREKLKSGKDCDQWKENKRLFGCYPNEETPEAPVTGMAGPLSKDDNSPKKNVEPVPPLTTRSGATHYLQISYYCLAFILFAILFNN